MMFVAPRSLAGLKCMATRRKKVREMREERKRERKKKVLLAVAFSSGALGEAPGMAAVPVCVCVCDRESEKDQLGGGKGSGCTPLSPLQPNTDTFTLTYMQLQQ